MQTNNHRRTEGCLAHLARQAHLHVASGSGERRFATSSGKSHGVRSKASGCLVGYHTTRENANGDRSIMIIITQSSGNICVDSNAKFQLFVILIRVVFFPIFENEMLEIVKPKNWITYRGEFSRQLLIVGSLDNQSLDIG